MGTMQRCDPNQAPRKWLDVLAVSERALTSLVERSFASEADFTQGGTKPNCPTTSSRPVAPGYGCSAPSTEGVTGLLRMKTPGRRGQTWRPTAVSRGAS